MGLSSPFGGVFGRGHAAIVRLAPLLLGQEEGVLTISVRIDLGPVAPHQLRQPMAVVGCPSVMLWLVTRGPPLRGAHPKGWPLGAVIQQPSYTLLTIRES